MSTPDPGSPRDNSDRDRARPDRAGTDSASGDGSRGGKGRPPQRESRGGRDRPDRDRDARDRPGRDRTDRDRADREGEEDGFEGMDRYQRIEAKERQRERDTRITRPEPELWVDEGPVDSGGARKGNSGSNRRRQQDRQQGDAAKPRGAKSAKRRGEASPKVTVDAPGLVGMVGKKRGERLSGRLNEAALAFLEDRYLDARRILKPIVDEVPALPQARELYGLTLYRLGRWKPAVDQLEELRILTNHSAEQNHVLADCYRALGMHDRVEELWLELREASPGADVVSEGRIVAAGSKADQGNYPAAIAILSKGFKLPRQPEEFHLRRAYALADLYERSGDLVQARSIFERVESAEPDYLDVEERISALG